jgi:glycosyltransferase involved in cell wall biosynthesis
MTISIIIITRNEAANLEDCLRSVSFASEVVVLDGGSSDRTQEIALHMGARFEVGAEWGGFGLQKNRALALATSDWVLSIDADERVTPELREEILGAVASPYADAYAVPRLSWFCGRFMRHSGWYPDYVVRLFRRGTAKFCGSVVHERLVTNGSVAKLRSPLLHYSYRNFSQVLAKLQIYSSGAVEELAAAGKRPRFGSGLVHGLWAFVRTYLLRLGFLDGRLGFALAFFNAETTYYKYIKFWHQAHRSA